MRNLKKSHSLPKSLTERKSLDLVNYLNGSCGTCWISARDSAILHLLYGCGLRISEALSLTLNNIINDQLALRITGKGKKTRIVPLLPSVTTSITQYKKLCPFHLEKSLPIFRGTHGKPLNPGVFQRNIRNLRQCLNLPENTTPHTLRHSYGTHLLRNGLDLRCIQDLLGHSRLSTTQIYTRVDDKKMLEIYDRSHPLLHSFPEK